MTKKLPTVSTCIPNYNHSRFLPHVLSSVLEQSCPPTELLVIDDGSTDDSIQVLQKYADRHPIIRLVRNDRNRGVVYTLNRCLELATGSFVHCLAADDWILPGFYERSLALLAEHPQSDISCTTCVQFEDSTQTTASPFHPWSLMPRYFTPDELVGVKSNGHIISQTCLIRRAALLEAGGFRPELRWHCDWFLNWVVAFRSGICHVPEPLAVMRLLSTSYSTGTRAWEEQRVVLDNLLHLLKDPQYSDVRPYFSRSGILFSLNDRQAIVRTVLENPELCDSDTRGILVEMLERAYGRDLGPPRQTTAPVPYSPAYLGPKVGRLVDRWKVSNRRVVIFGAGDHTANLFQWTSLAGAQLVGLIDSNPSLHGQWYWGLEIVHPDRIRSLRPDVILISSQAYQEAIYETLRPLEADGIEIVRLYATSRR